jgi:formyltetrahydrofolate hydrolase
VHASQNLVQKPIITQNVVFVAHRKNAKAAAAASDRPSKK